MGKTFDKVPTFNSNFFLKIKNKTRIKQNLLNFLKAMY